MRWAGSTARSPRWLIFRRLVRMQLDGVEVDRVRQIHVHPPWIDGLERVTGTGAVRAAVAGIVVGTVAIGTVVRAVPSRNTSRSASSARRSGRRSVTKNGSKSARSAARTAETALAEIVPAETVPGGARSGRSYAPLVVSGREHSAFGPAGTGSPWCQPPLVAAKTGLNWRGCTGQRTVPRGCATVRGDT